MDEQSKSKGTKEKSHEVSCRSQRGPKRIDPYEKFEKISQGDLGKKDKKDGTGENEGNEKSLQGVALFLIDDHSKTWYKKKQYLRRPV